jgi:preprotein translocase subunit SecG
MYNVITIFILVAALLLILIVLVQNSKGGGLSAGFSSTNQIMGVRKTTDFLEKATWGLAGIILLLSIVSAAFIPSQSEQDAIIAPQSVEQQAPAQANPGFETSAPEAAPKADSAK